LAKSPAEAAARADVVVSSLVNDEAALSIVTGKQRILSSLRPSAIHVVDEELRAPAEEIRKRRVAVVGLNPG
jgi:3-hydroxyisobutyrate dehydrogenase-like beta-hydroxyacid dehydrogenase